ncbi:MAG: hypothetical protein FWG66_01625 [Spirochaetes bacterium]|nr:hypothetical protein [Spirochaetota bacterium]
MKNFVLILVFALGATLNVPLGAQALTGQMRAFDDVFPNLPAAARAAVFSPNGYFRFAAQADSPGGFAVLGAAGSIDPEIVNSILAFGPSHLAQTLLVLPRQAGSTNLLHVYNALSEIGALEGRLYHSHRRGRYIPLFEEASRVDNDRRGNDIPDPPAAAAVPASETFYIRLRDVNFGNTFYRADVALAGNGLVYRMVNSRNMTYLFIPVIRAGNFTAQLYFEIIEEGVLIYGLSGVNVSNLHASMVDMGSAISRRLAVVIEWVTDGIQRTAGP